MSLREDGIASEAEVRPGWVAPAQRAVEQGAPGVPAASPQRAACARLPGVLRSGFLFKHGGGPGGWTKRWFVAHVDGFTYHYLTERDAKPKGSIPCHGALVRALDAQEHAAEGFFGLAIVLGNKKRVLYAAAPAELEPWVKAISRAARADGTLGGPQGDLPASALALEAGAPLLGAAADAAGGEAAREGAAPLADAALPERADPAADLRPDGRARAPGAPGGGPSRGPARLPAGGRGGAAAEGQGGAASPDAPGSPARAARLRAAAYGKPPRAPAPSPAPASAARRAAGDDEEARTWQGRSEEGGGAREGEAEAEGPHGYWQPLDEDAPADARRSPPLPGWATPTAGVGALVRADAKAAAEVGEGAGLDSRPGAGWGADAESGDEWEVDEEGYRVRKPPRPRPARRAASEGGARSGAPAWGGQRRGGAEEGADQHAGKADSEAGEEAEEEFRPVLQIRIREATDALSPSSSAALKSAAAALRSSRVPLPPTCSRARPTAAQLAARSGNRGGLGLGGRPALTHTWSAPAEIGAADDSADNGRDGAAGARARAARADWGWAESLEFPPLEESSPDPSAAAQARPREFAQEAAGSKPHRGGGQPQAEAGADADADAQEPSALPAARLLARPERSPEDAARSPPADATRWDRPGGAAAAAGAAAADGATKAGSAPLDAAGKPGSCGVAPALSSPSCASSSSSTEGSSPTATRSGSRSDGSAGEGARSAAPGVRTAEAAERGAADAGAASAPRTRAGAGLRAGEPETAASLVQSALLLLERARYAEARKLLARCLRQLTAPIAAQPEPHGGAGGSSGSLLADVSFCVRYHVAASLLMQLGRLGRGGDGLAERARLSALLAALPLLPRHRRTCVGIAIIANLPARNHGLVAALASTLGSKPLALTGSAAAAQDEELAQLRRQCEAEGLGNSGSVLVPCRTCGSQTLVSASECDECGARVHVCCASHRVLTGDKFTWCRLCLCLFSPEAAPFGSSCRVCSTGVVIPGCSSDISGPPRSSADQV